MSWDFDVKSEGTKTNYTKFPVGVTRVRFLDDSPNVRWAHWMPQFQRSVNCPGKGCPIDAIRNRQKADGEPQTYGMSRKFAMNIWNYETNQMEILEQGITFFQDLKDVMTDLKEQGKSIQDATLKVRRRGSGKDDTTYRIDIDEIVPPSEAIQVAMLEKVDLNEFFKPHTIEQITQLLAVTENHKEAWNEIIHGNESEKVEFATASDEDFTVK